MVECINPKNLKAFINRIQIEMSGFILYEIRLSEIRQEEQNSSSCLIHYPELFMVVL